MAKTGVPSRITYESGVCLGLRRTPETSSANSWASFEQQLRTTDLEEKSRMILNFRVACEEISTIVGHEREFGFGLKLKFRTGLFYYYYFIILLFYYYIIIILSDMQTKTRKYVE